MAAPSHVQIRPHEEQVVLIYFTRSFGGSVEHVERRIQFSKRLFQTGSIGVCTAEPEQGISRAQAIMQRQAVAQQNVWEAGAWPRRRDVARVVRVGAVARLGPNNW